jgi:hypothetical protein
VLEIMVSDAPIVGALRTSSRWLALLLRSADTIKLPGRGIFLPEGEMLFDPYVTWRVCVTAGVKSGGGCADTMGITVWRQRKRIFIVIMITSQLEEFH